MLENIEFEEPLAAENTSCDPVSHKSLDQQVNSLKQERAGCGVEELDALALFLDSTHISSSSQSKPTLPSPTDIWISALDADWPGELGRLPLLRIDGHTCLPDAKILCEHVKSKNMLQRIYDMKYPCPIDMFELPEHRTTPDLKNVAHIAMHHNWPEMVDKLRLSGEEKVRFAIQGTHYEYFSKQLQQHELPELADGYIDDFADRAAWNGRLDVLNEIYTKTKASHGGDAALVMMGSYEGMDLAARQGRLDIIMWIHTNLPFNGCSMDAMDGAARNGHLDVVKWLHANRIEGCSRLAMHYAAMNGHLEVVKWLHENRKEGCSFDTMDKAALKGQLEVIQWMHANRKEGCTKNAMNGAAGNGHLQVVKWLHDIGMSCTPDAMDLAAANGHLEVLKWLDETRDEGCTAWAVDEAAKNGHFEVVKWLIENSDEGWTMNALDNAVKNGHRELSGLLRDHMFEDNMCEEDATQSTLLIQN